MPAATPRVADPTLLRWQTGVRIAAISLFLFGLWLRWTDSFVAITTPDSFVFLNGAMTGDLGNVAWRTFIYPLFLKFCIEHLGGLTAVVVLQKLFGLATATFTFAAWVKLKQLVRYTRWGQMVHDVLGLLLFALMLLPYGSTRFYEQSIMLESSSALILAAIVFSACQLFVVSKSSGRSTTAVVWASLLILLSLFANALNPRFGPVILLSLVLALACLRSVRATLRQCLLGLVTPAIFGVLLFYLPQVPLNRRNIWNKTLLDMHLFFMHARLILPELVHDAQAPDFTRYDRPFLKQLSSLIADELVRAEREGSGGNETLGYDPNRLIWGPADDLVRRHFANSPASYNEFCRYYFGRALWHQPLGYLHKVALEWWYLFRPGGPIIDDNCASQSLAVALADMQCPVLASAYVHEARDAVRPAFASYQAQVSDPRNYAGAVFRTPLPLRYFGSFVREFFLVGWLTVCGFCGYCLWRIRGDPGLTNLCLVFLGISVVLFSELAPLTLFTTTCGIRAVQGLRVLFAFTTVAMGLLALLLAASLTGWRHHLIGAADATAGKAAGP